MMSHDQLDFIFVKIELGRKKIVKNYKISLSIMSYVTYTRTKLIEFLSF